MPLPLIAAGALEALLVRVVGWVLVAKLGAAVLRVFTFLGVAWATNEYIVAPATAQILQLWGGIPAELQAWIGFFRLDIMASMLMSAYTIVGARKVFLAKAGG